MAPSRVFLGTAEPFPQLVAKRILHGISGLPDLGNIIITVPGTFASAALQESLAANAQYGLLMPQIITPGILLHNQEKSFNLPGQLENELIWNRVATSAAASGNFDLLFPHVTVGKGCSGSSFSRLRIELAAGGFSIADAVEALGNRGPQLAELEKLYLQELSACGFDDPLHADLAAVESVDFVQNVDKIILAGLTDIPRLLRKKLENIDRKYPGKIEIWVQAEQSDCNLYDEYGSAIAENWRKHPISIPDFNSHVHITSTVSQAAEKIKKIFENCNDLVYDDTVVLLGDMTLLPTLQRELAQWAAEQGGELELYDPSGVAFSDLRLHKLGSALCEFICNSNSFDAALNLVKEQDFLNYICHLTQNSENFVLNKLDSFTTSTFPDEFLPALKLMKEKEIEVLEKAFGLLKKLANDFEHTTLPEFLREFFTEVYTHRKGIDNTLYRGISFVSECSLLKSSLNILAKQEKVTETTDKKELFELFWKLTGQEKLAARPSKAHITVQGCLEIPYINHKNIIFCGVNSNCYPDRISPTTFLTNSKRKKIGIRSDEDTFARAASHFNALCANIGNGKNLNMIVIKMAPDSTPLQPSPLFFSGNLALDELTSRAKYLFPESLENIRSEKFSQAVFKEFRLAPVLDFKTVPDHPDIPALSITDFKSYISDPMAFFLQRVCGADDTDYLTGEPDNALIGTLCHEALQMLGNEVFSSADEYQKELRANLAEVMRQYFGAELPPLLKIIHANLAQRLDYAAAVLFQTSGNAGFVPLETEYSLGGEKKYIPYYTSSDDKNPIAVIKGKIDRIEYNAEKNLIRIIDFKTGKDGNVINSHCDIKKDNVTGDITSVKFHNLQLPLYALMLRQDKEFAKKHKINMNKVSICCAYLLIPGNVTATSLNEWDAYSLDEIMPFVMKKVEMVVNEISLFKQQKISCKANKSKVFRDWFLPDTLNSTIGVTWVEESDEECRK